MQDFRIFVTFNEDKSYSVAIVWRTDTDEEAGFHIKKKAATPVTVAIAEAVDAFYSDDIDTGDFNESHNGPYNRPLNDQEST